MPETNILIVDDDRELCELLSEYLKAEGFAVRCVFQGRDGVESALSGEYALVVLDFMLPEFNGMEVLRRIRAQSQIPVLMLTARVEETDRILGLEIGADDYMHKPFNPRELAVRIRAILRRTHAAAPSEAVQDMVSLGDISVYIGAREVRKAGVSVSLTAIEFGLLLALLRSAGKVLTREDLTRAAFERKRLPYERTIDMHVSNLRKKLGDHPGGQERIRGVRSVGYLYTLPVKNEGN